MGSLMLIAEILALAVAVLLSIPVLVLSAEILAGLSRRRPFPLSDVEDRPRIAVLVPAHDEGAGVIPTVQDVRTQLVPGDRIVVVADNCTDSTAVHAYRAGAEVVERKDSQRHGKGYALDFGIRHLAANPPDVLVIVDADCRLHEHALERLAKSSAATNRPCQALYQMAAPPDAAVNLQVAVFAWRVKNQIRPAGLQTLGLPCQLMGTGMAFPWGLISAVELDTGQVVEDLQLGLDLAQAGHPPLFCQNAVVRSSFPSSNAGTFAQRKRWEHGHIQMIRQDSPLYLRRALRDRNWPLLALTLDLLVPPVSLLVALMMVTTLLGAALALVGGSSTALAINLVSFAAFFIALVTAWWAQGRDLLPLNGIPAIVTYIGRKVGSYPAALFCKPKLHWTRSERRKDEPNR